MLHANAKVAFVLAIHKRNDASAKLTINAPEFQ